MKDYLIRATAMKGKVRVFAVLTTQLTEQLRAMHHTEPTATAVLGRTAAVAAMMGAMLKDDQKLTIQIQGGGPIGQIVVDANADGEIRGYVDHPETSLPKNEKGKLDVAGAVGKDGFIHVIKDLGLKEPYRGSIPIISGELGEDFTYYFAKSEQTPSAVAVGVLVDVDRTVKASGGIIVQVLPGIGDDDLSFIEQQMTNMIPITTLIESGKSMEEILHEVLGEVTVLETKEIIFKCKCSRERVQAMLSSIGEDEIRTMLEEDGKAEVVCHFCNSQYKFNDHDLRELIK